MHWPVQAQLQGHGGPVRSLSVTADGALAISGSFDTSAILWGLETGTALRVLRGHDGPVNAVLALPGGRFLTGGEEGHVLLWQFGRNEPVMRFTGHQGPVSALVGLPDGQGFASASWDGTTRVQAFSGEAAKVLLGHQGQVLALAVSGDGKSLITGGYDGFVRISSLGEGAGRARNLSSPVNALAAFRDGRIAAGTADGKVHFLTPDLTGPEPVQAAETPVIALSLSPDESLLAAAAIRGSVALVETGSRAVRQTLVGPGLPVWAAAFRPGTSELLTGGNDRLVRRWNVANGEHLGAIVIAAPQGPLAGLTGERGAEVFRACAACHTLTKDGGNRAGPTLYGLFGRKIATAPGYVYSEPLTKMDIVWTRETVSKLFEVGPNAYTPGTKMPEQTIGSAEDRSALMDFLERTTKEN